ncbi:MAG: DUF3472 domain-containing protein [Polyangiaceae bacterium]
MIAPDSSTTPIDAGGSVLADSSSPADADAADGAVAKCGDGICALTESATSCCADCGVCIDNGRVEMTTGVAGGQPGAGVTPGGMADTHAYFAGGPFTDLSFPFTVTTQPVANATYFWAQQFFFTNTTQGGYLGMQTHGNAGGTIIDKMFIFSIFDGTAATPLPGGATCEPFGGEGVGYSCRLAFAWRENVTYTFTLKQAAASKWSVTVHDPTSGSELGIGTITAPATWGTLQAASAGFTEYFTEVNACAATPLAKAYFHSPRAGGTPPTSVSASTYGTCVAQATSVCTGSLCK